MYKLALALLLMAGTAQAAPQLTGPATGGASTGASFTATSYSSAPVMYVSTLAVTSANLKIYANDGALMIDSDLTGSGRGIRIGAGVNSDSVTGSLEISDSDGSDPWLYFRRNDTTVTAGELLGGTMYRDRDSSTGGASNKAYDVYEAVGGWSSGQTMEVIRRLAFKPLRYSEPKDFYVFTSTGLLIRDTNVGEAGTPLESCSTCQLQIISPVGSGLSVTGAINGTTFYIGNGPSIGTDADADYPLVFRSERNMAFMVDTNGDDITSWLWCRNNPTVAGCTATMQLNQSGELYGLVRVLSSNAIFGDGTGSSCSTCTVHVQGSAGTGLSVQRNLQVSGTTYLAVGNSAATWTPGKFIFISTMASNSSYGVLSSTTSVGGGANEFATVTLPVGALPENGMGMTVTCSASARNGATSASVVRWRVTLCGQDYSFSTQGTPSNAEHMAQVEFLRFQEGQMIASGFSLGSDNNAYALSSTSNVPASCPNGSTMLIRCVLTGTVQGEYNFKFMKVSFD